ncbi:hypothetical protein V491_01426 [Pseudogymnoascus sp. VKM F-3775]|nr:hypothetical protein V491_01426 [Pseudogymnoascus sp. VKM F-3775]
MHDEGYRQPRKPQQGVPSSPSTPPVLGLSTPHRETTETTESFSLAWWRRERHHKVQEQYIDKNPSSMRHLHLLPPPGYRVPHVFPQYPPMADDVSTPTPTPTPTDTRTSPSPSPFPIPSHPVVDHPKLQTEYTN